MQLAQLARRIDPRTLFAAFKYGVYALISVNLCLFFGEELVASAHTFGEGLALSQLGQAFAASIDTAAWLLLLLLFELETSVIPRDKLRGGLKWPLHGVRGVCYVLIAYSCWGYVAKLVALSDFAPVQVADGCSLVAPDTVLAVDLDEYVPFDAESCAALETAELYRLSGQGIFADRGALVDLLRLAWVDVINAVAWILVALLLEIDVWLQLRRLMSDPLMQASRLLKGVLYATLFAAAVYWGVKGDFVDFWDAFLWLVAFAFIEMNFFEWHAEAGSDAAAGSPA